jgi:hypothetical protein
MTDGSIKEVAAFDFSDWSQEAMELLRAHLIKEKKASEHFDSAEPPMGRCSAMSDTDLTDQL